MPGAASKKKGKIMSVNYIKNNLSKDEQILLSVKTSPLLVWSLIMIWTVAAIGCLTADSVEPVVRVGGIIFGLIALITYLHYRAIEMVITNKRIVLKKGIIATNTEEIRVEKCESTRLKKGLAGVFFNYGDIIFSGTGNATLIWKTIASPKKVRKQIEDIFETYGQR